MCRRTSSFKLMSACGRFVISKWSYAEFGWSSDGALFSGNCRFHLMLLVALSFYLRHLWDRKAQQHLDIDAASLPTPSSLRVDLCTKAADQHSEHWPVSIPRAPLPPVQTATTLRFPKREFPQREEGRQSSSHTAIRLSHFSASDLFL
ncbi:hypothetical protein M011DRAFT_109781 [Sporormia fimetaria CBS 119925]|uniref:Uncharacterized protein n=1 Tax=Sporormia fimetaria CBS 119925 TaxID=1340428 RepID=A0A6A6VL18_9PLEO|nr:hypothetical protein M011DRAFT_109781 [Sporormia fimetaria CBS 119925]